MSRLSILIPWRESSSQFESTLVSILANRPHNTEVIVVHRGAYGDPYALGREVLFVEHDDDASLAALVNRGLQVAGGDVVHLLSCGITVEEGWSDGVREVFAEDATLGGLIPLVVDASHPERVVNSGVALSMTGAPKTVGAGRSIHRPAVNAWGPSLLAGFYRLSAVRELGGFCEEVGEHADVDLAGSLLQADYEISTAPECQLAYDASESCAQPASPRELERLFWRHRPLLGATSLLAHFASAACAGMVSLCTGGGTSNITQRLGAVLERSSYSQHRAAIASATCVDESDATAEFEASDGAAVLSLDAARHHRESTPPKRRAA